jgi:hypothetical protein
MTKERRESKGARIATITESYLQLGMGSPARQNPGQGWDCTSGLIFEPERWTGPGSRLQFLRFRQGSGRAYRAGSGFCQSGLGSGLIYRPDGQAGPVRA